MRKSENKALEKPQNDKSLGQFESALFAAKIKIVKFDSSKQRPVSTGEGTMNIEKFSLMLRARLGADAVNYPDVFKALHDQALIEGLLEAYSVKQGVSVGKNNQELILPSDMEGLTLNFNMSSNGRDQKFFLTDKNENISRISGDAYILARQLSLGKAVAESRCVIPMYMPRSKPGISMITQDGRQETVFNTYSRPNWYRTSSWEKNYDKPPKLVQKLNDHLFPVLVDEEYCYSWLHASLFERAPTFLILSGAPGIGKNRLKLLFRALHGFTNSIDGKRSTIVERFNSQLSEATLAWFDELKYDAEMENTMKELQNDSISIERKGVDATRATRIFASIVISNNRPRDNYIDFDSRKFVPLQLTDKRLEESMTSDEINTLTKKIENPESPDYDLEFIAQIAKWIRCRGRSKKWPNLEYKGPMFWKLAHTSMTQWQKHTVTRLLDPLISHYVGWDSKKSGVLWSEFQSHAIRRSSDKNMRFPDYTSSRVFIDVFRDSEGRKVFETELVPGINMLGDFWVKLLYKKNELIKRTGGRVNEK